MPKSKRDKKISLTKTDKKGLALKQKIIEDVRNCVEKFNSIYVISYSNMRTEKMKEVRNEWKPSRFFFGKNKVLGVGLGTSPENEVADDLHKISECLKGQCCLLFTNCTNDEVVEWFAGFEIEDFARSGTKVKETIVLKEGPLKQFPHSLESRLRQLGMPTKLDRGVVTLIKDFQVCKAGISLTPEQARILIFLGHKLASFKLQLKAKWTKGEGFEKFSEENEDEQSEEEMETADDND